MILKFTILDS